MSLEAADRPNFFLHTTANGSIGLAKWHRSETFHQHASFSLHRGTWQAGLVALESLAKPGSFLHSSDLELALRTYEHTEAFRGGALFRLLGKGLSCHRSWARGLLPPSAAFPSLSPLSFYPPTLLIPLAEWRLPGLYPWNGRWPDLHIGRLGSGGRVGSETHATSRVLPAATGHLHGVKISGLCVSKRKSEPGGGTYGAWLQFPAQDTYCP